MKNSDLTLKALQSCQETYSEFNQFEGEWIQSFDSDLVKAALKVTEPRVGNIVKEVTEGIIIQQVNAQGVMGSGVAKDIRDRYPVVFEEYSKVVKPNGLYDRGIEYMGMMIPVQVDTNLWVCNIVGQQFYGREPEKQWLGRYTSYDALQLGLRKVYQFALENFVLTDDLKWATRPTIHYPLIGCGLGGGEWSIVKAIIDSELKGLKHHLWVLSENDKPAAC